MTQDIELQDLPTVATNDIPPDSLIPIAFRESNLTPFELYKITLQQLRIKLATLNVEEIYNAFEKDSIFTNMLFDIQNNLIILNYDETKLNNLINDVQNFVVPQLQEILLALSNQTTGSLYNMFQELTTIYNILDYLNQQALNALKTIIFSIPSRINDTLPYSVENNYSNTNNQYSLYLEGFYNIVYVNIFIDTQVNLDRVVSINIFNVQQVFETLALNLEGNITEFKISYRLKNGLKANLQNIVEKRPITFYKSNFADLEEVLYTLDSLETSLAEGGNFSFSLWFNKDGYIANDYNSSKELLAEADIPRINDDLSQSLKYITNNDSLNYSEDGTMFFSKFVLYDNTANIIVSNINSLIRNRLFMLDLDCSNISEQNIIFVVTIGLAFATLSIENPKKRALFVISTNTDAFFNIAEITGTILLNGISSEGVTEISLVNETTSVQNDVQNLIIYQAPTEFSDQRTITLNIIGDRLENIEIILDLEAVNQYYVAYSFQINTSPIRTIPLIWIGNPNNARKQIKKIKISYNVAKNDVSTEILDSQALSEEMVNFANTEIRLLSNQFFGINFYAPLGILSNRSSLNNPFGTFDYSVSNVSLDIPRRENEYRFRGGLYAKSFDIPESLEVVITQEIHLVDWDMTAGIGSIPKNPDEKTFYIFIDNLDKKYYCDLHMQFQRDYASSFDIAFLLGAPTAIIDDPTPNFTTTYGYQIAGNVEIFRKTIPANSPQFLKVQFVLDVVGGVAIELPYTTPIIQRFDSSQYWTIPQVQAYVAQQIAIIISGGTIDLSGYATIQNLNDAIALTVPLNQYNIDQNIVNSKLNDLENRVDVVEGDILTINGEIVTINNDIIDINQSIDDINLEINVIDASIIDLQNQIDLKASILYVNNINAQNQVQIVPYQII
jgi:hypothetical protein